MENKNVIILLIAIIVVPGVVVGAMFLQTCNAKEPIKLKLPVTKHNMGGEYCLYAN